MNRTGKMEKMNTVEKKDTLGNVFLLLATINRKNGQQMLNAIQYEELEEEYFLIVPRGFSADWLRNIHANPWVDVQVKGRKFHALAEPVIDPGRIADFLEKRLAENSQPVLDRVRAHGLPSKPSRAQLEALSGTLTLIALHPSTP
jgi:hypothetical protein